MYRVVQYYDSWPFRNDSRVPHGSKSRRRRDTFRTLGPVRDRLARANGDAQYQRRNGGDWSAFVVIAEQLTGDGWQPIDVDLCHRDQAADALPDPGVDHGGDVARVGQAPLPDRVLEYFTRVQPSQLSSAQGT